MIYEIKFQRLTGKAGVRRRMVAGSARDKAELLTNSCTSVRPKIETSDGSDFHSARMS